MKKQVVPESMMEMDADARPARNATDAQIANNLFRREHVKRMAESKRMLLVQYNWQKRMHGSN